jgi:Tol biopolymer transport system component
MMPRLAWQSVNLVGRIHCLAFVLAFTAGPLQGAEKPYAIYVMKADGSQARKLVQVDGYADHEAPRWSRDGKQVVFNATDSNTRTDDLFVVNADGTGLRKLGPGARADWSPDGKQIASDTGREIFVQNLDGQGRESVSSGQSPRWSPDGSQMAVVENNMLHVIDMVTGERRAMFAEPFTLVYSGVCWSPDGRHIALVAQPVQGPRRQLLIVSSQGSDHGVQARLQTEGGMSSSPSYSPDGKRLAYSAAYLIMVVEVEGTQRPRMLADQKGKNFEPCWSPDGQWFVFTSNRE